MISKTKIEKRLRKKTNPELVETIRLAKKNNLLELAKKLIVPTRLHKKMNLDKLNEIKETNIIFVGKILGSGNIHKKINISALGFSEQAKEKLKKAGCGIKIIKQEIEDNKTLKGVKLI
jgi:ribosomal protein L18E